MKTAFIGSVELSFVALRKMIELGYKPDMVFSLDERVSKKVSDYYPLHLLAEREGIAYKKYCKVIDIQRWLNEVEYDYLFVIGLSQMLPKSMLSMIKRYSIGFHPTSLPKYRGRAPIPWMILLGEQEANVTLFKMDEGVDSGDIIIQEPYCLRVDDYAHDVYIKVEKSLEIALEKSLPLIYSNNISFVPQDENKATYLLKRRPCDGKINWANMNGKQIYDLIRAASFPYPGAFSVYGECIVRFDRANLLKNDSFFGQAGQVAKISNGKMLVLTRDRYMLEIEKYKFISEKEPKITVGGRFS